MNICIYGAVNTSIDESYMEAGKKLGLEIAKRNHDLIYCGMKDGIMGAAAKTFRENSKNKIVAIMPEFFKEIKQDEMYKECDETFFTDDVPERNKKFRELADAIIVTPGGVGTFNELFDAICVKRWGFFDKPIVIYNINHYYDKLIDMLEYAIAEKFGRENYRETYKVYDELDEMFEYIEGYNK